MKGVLPREAIMLRERREALNLTQEQLAIEVGIQLQQYQRFEYGTRKLSACNLRTALKICAALELDPYEIAFEEDLDMARGK